MLSIALSVAFALAVPAPALPGAAAALSPSDQVLLSRVLESDCGVEDAEPLWRAVEAAGSRLVPALAAAVADGPPPARRAAFASAARARYQRYQALLRLDTRTTFRLDSDTAFVERELSRFVRAYRQRGVRALGWIGGEAARQALAAIRDPELQPYVDRALALTVP